MKENRGNRTLKDSSGISSKLEGPVETSLNDSAEHQRDRKLAVSKKIKTIERLESESVLEMEVVVETAKSAFHRTIQQSLEPKHKPKELSSDSIAPIGVGCYEDEADMTASTKDMNAELEYSSKRLRETRFSDGNPPLSEDEDRVETQAPDARRWRKDEHLGEKLNKQTSGQGPYRHFRKKSKEPKNSSTAKHGKKEGKCPGRFRLFSACFGGGFRKEDKITESVLTNEQPGTWLCLKTLFYLYCILDPFVLPSRRSPNSRDCSTHRYYRRQAFIRTMMESHLESHCN